jgi:hypothetical protein
MYGKRGAKVIWALIGISLFVFLIFPFFGDFLRGIISLDLTPLSNLGSTLTWVGILVTVVGVGWALGSKKPDTKSVPGIRPLKIVLVGVILIVIGLFLENPLSLFSEGGAGFGYH